MPSNPQELREIHAILRKCGDAHGCIEFGVGGATKTAGAEELLHDAASASVGANTASFWKQEVELAVIDPCQHVGVTDASEDTFRNLNRGGAEQRSGGVAALFDAKCREGESSRMASCLVDFATGDIDEVGEGVRARRGILHRAAAALLAFHDEGKRHGDLWPDDG